MMQFITLISFSAVLLSLSPNKQKPFPAFQYYSIDGKEINNEIFNNNESIVVLGHLGCHALMLLLKDLQDTTFSPNFQTIIILANTKEQILDFNAPSSNMWSTMRSQYELEPLTGIVIGECEHEKIEYSQSDTMILHQCRYLGKKLRTKSSPSTYFVNEEGEIERTFKGYIVGGDKRSRFAYLFAGN